MDVSIKAKERFCKDCNIPLKLFQEPYFTDRINLYDRFYKTIEKWDLFVNEFKKYNCEQDYFEEYNRVKDEAILSIKNSEAYQRFNEEDMNKYRVNNVNLPNNDIFKSSNDGKSFLSIDMRKANFSSLNNYSSKMFEANTWEGFIGRFTDNKHIINSKYIRQVILGNCNPKRHITYEKHIMDGVLGFITKFFISIDKVIFFSNDEIVFDVTDIENKKHFIDLQQTLDDKAIVPFKVELFTLHKITGTDGYYKDIYSIVGQNTIEFKCLDNYMLPFVIRKFMKEEITESDKVFYHEGLLSKFIETPEIII